VKPHSGIASGTQGSPTPLAAQPDDIAPASNTPARSPHVTFFVNDIRIFARSSGSRRAGSLAFAGASAWCCQRRKTPCEALAPYVAARNGVKPDRRLRTLLTTGLRPFYPRAAKEAIFPYLLAFLGSACFFDRVPGVQGLDGSR
jgi:hypothetical protein